VQQDSGIESLVASWRRKGDACVADDDCMHVAFVASPVAPHEIRGIVVLLKSGKSSQL
jgi:hypothetical protein